MRRFLQTVVVLIVLVAAYWGWALVGAAELASVASQGDPQALMQRIDLPALRRSLASQIARAYLEQNPQFQKMFLLEQDFLGSVSAGAANEALTGILTPENIAALLAKGRVGLAPAGDSRFDWRMPPLSEAFRAGPLQALMHSRFDGPLSFVVGVVSPQGRYGVHLHLSGTTWRLSGLDVPGEVRAELARAIAERVRRLSSR
ncbi:DUF2939 domain-containing protein [Roseiarcus sp.]|uniref:DUF2939 domain-containing protein n=1 Tax=Roseiarcus sp. TaxID=1969460 RepID=UPI003F9BC016